MASAPGESEHILISEEIIQSLNQHLSIKASYSARFSADDKKLAYLSDATGVPQAWVKELNADRGAERLTVGDERVGFISYAPKTDRFAYGVDLGGSEHFQIRLLPRPGDVPVKLTDSPDVIHIWGDWSPDEKNVTYASNARDRRFFDIYVQRLDDLSRELVVQQDGHNYPVSWSPDGSSILFSRVNAPFDNDLFLFHLRDRVTVHLTPHEGEAVYRSPDFDASGNGIYCITDQRRNFTGLAKIDIENASLDFLYEEERELEELAVSDDGNSLAFTVNDGGYTRLMEKGSAMERPTAVQMPPSVVGGLEWSHRGDKLAFTLTSSVQNSDVWLSSPGDGSSHRLIHSSTAGIDEESFVEAESFASRSFDGLQIPSLFYRPRQTSQQYPLIVVLHGGPEAQSRPAFSPLVQFFVKLGFGVLAPNFRGSTGYGREFTHLDDVYNRMKAVRDVEACVTTAMRIYPIDRARLAAWGGSYGGFMVLACLYSQPDLWRAGVDIVGISNFVTFLNRTGPWRRALRIPEYGDPEKDKDFLEGISPNNNAHLIRAPLFIIHGVNDPRVPLGEAEQILDTMQKLGRESHLLKFQDEGHGLVKLKNRIAGYSAAVEFLLKHLGGAGRDS